MVECVLYSSCSSCVFFIWIFKMCFQFLFSLKHMPSISMFFGNCIFRGVLHAPIAMGQCEYACSSTFLAEDLFVFLVYYLLTIECCLYGQYIPYPHPLFMPKILTVTLDFFLCLKTANHYSQLVRVWWLLPNNASTLESLGKKI